MSDTSPCHSYIFPREDLTMTKPTVVNLTLQALVSNLGKQNKQNTEQNQTQNPTTLLSTLPFCPIHKTLTIPVFLSYTP